VTALGTHHSVVALGMHQIMTCLV